MESETVFYTYILLCSDHTLYTGYTPNLLKRLQKHQKGQGAKYTRGRLPVKLLYFEEYPIRQQAMSREYQIKKLRRHEKQELIASVSPARAAEIDAFNQITEAGREAGTAAGAEQKS